MNWERRPCEGGGGFYETLYIDNSDHYFSITKWDDIDTFFLRYVCDGLVRIKTSTKVNTLDEAKSVIIYKTLESLYKAARNYDHLYELVCEHIGYDYPAKEDTDG